MSVLNDGNAATLSVLGARVSKADAQTVGTVSLFTVSGLVLITSLVGKVTTAITVAGTTKLQANPTTGTTGNLCAASDLGTNDTLAGNLLSITGGPGDAMVGSGLTSPGVGTVPLFGTAGTLTVGDAPKGVYVAAGAIERVTATGADGAVTWTLTYVPIENGATVVAV